MFDYSFMLPNILILGILLLFYFLRPRLRTRRNRTFFGLLALECLVILFDLLASYADENYAYTAGWLINFLNTGFFLFFLTRTYWFFRFTTDLLGLLPEDKPVVKWIARSLFILSALIAFSSSATGAFFTVAEDGYHHGPLYELLYINIFAYVTASAVLLILSRKRLTTRERAAAFGYLAMLLVGAIIRKLMPQYLVMDLFCMCAVLIIYLACENPEFFISDRGPAFNARAFREMLEERTRKRYRVVGFVLRNYVDNRGVYGGKQVDRGIALINEFLVRTFPRCSVFYLRNGCFAIMGGADLSWSEVRQRVLDRFQQPWKTLDADLFLSVAFIQVSWKNQVRSADRIISDMLIAFEEAGKLADPAQQIVDLDADREIDRQVDVKRALELALQNRRVEVFLQPLVDSRTRRVVAAEALARIRDGEGRIVPPASFIPIAEKSGHIVEMGEQVLETVCSFIRQQDLARLGLSWINVNLSPIQCMRKDLKRRFTAILDRYGVDPSQIHLELTEQSITDFAALNRQIEALQSGGFQFVLDDYGSGYSNLNRVKHYPFVNVKLDMEVVWDYYKERDTLIPAMIDAFKKMGYTITCEGIETEDMAAVMTGIGSDYLQGYYFDKPLPMEEFAAKYSYIKNLKK